MLFIYILRFDFNSLKNDNDVYFFIFLLILLIKYLNHFKIMAQISTFMFGNVHIS